MLKTEVGGVVYSKTDAAATTGAVTPLADRAFLCRRIGISNESAADDWQVIVGQREIMRVRHATVGSQRPFHLVSAGASTRLDFFEYCRGLLGVDATIPVPNGMSIVVQSVGGATADIDLELKEVDSSDAANYPTNHFMKGDFIIPIQWRVNAAIAAVGATQVDTQTAPPQIPAIFSNIGLPVQWAIDLLALFMEGAGVNTFSGAANHQSITDSLRVFRNQSQWFTRTGGGIPDRGQPSAAGSANTVIGQQSGIFPPFEQAFPTDDNFIPVPLPLRGGDAMQLLLNITGDVTGGASYANVLMMAVARIKMPGPVGAFA